MFKFTQPIPLTLYVHMPWCVRKCPYCDFNSHTLRKEIPENDYIDRLIADLEQDLPKIWGRRLSSIFIGGGTPSLFSAQAIEKLLREIHSRLPYSPDIEITLEANPGTIDLSKFKGFREAGVNRLSIGVQSFQDDKLKSLGRIHDSKAAYQAIEAAQSAGFKTFNIDLMYGLPKQSTQDALYDLQTGLSLGTTHLSWYHLTLEPNTLFYHQPPPLPDDDHVGEIQEQGRHLIAKTGFEQYEISAYCKTGHACFHNINYWEFGDYLGIGAGAHSKITDFEQQVAKRFWKIKNPKDYLDSTQNFIGDEKIISVKEMPFEFLLNALRLHKPIPNTLFEERSGLPLSSITEQLLLAQTKGLLNWNENTLQTTELGQRFLNDLLTLFLR